MYKRILTSTDGSELALRGVRAAAELAKLMGANLTIVTASELHLQIYAIDGINWQPNLGRQIHDAAYARDESRLKAALELAIEAGVAKDCVALVHGDDTRPSFAILAEAKERNCDLIVMGSHGRTGLSKLFLGSQTAEVLAETSLPVLIVK